MNRDYSWIRNAYKVISEKDHKWAEDKAKNFECDEMSFQEDVEKQASQLSYLLSLEKLAQASSAQLKVKLSRQKAILLVAIRNSGGKITVDEANARIETDDSIVQLQDKLREAEFVLSTLKADVEASYEKGKMLNILAKEKNNSSFEKE